MPVPNETGNKTQLLNALLEQRNELERKINEQKAILTKNGVGMNDSLVDEEDYPRSDIDVYQVRHARHEIICLQNDYKALMKEIEKCVDETFSQIRQLNESNGNSSQNVNNTNVSNTTFTIPFALVNHVTEGSPANCAGIRFGDKIVEFGSLNGENYKSLTQISEITQNSINREIIVKVLRGSGNIVELSLIPRSWPGRGLLGCAIVDYQP